MSGGEWIWLTRREAAAVAFVVEAALLDEEPSEVRASLKRALTKLRKMGAWHMSVPFGLAEELALEQAAVAELERERQAAFRRQDYFEALALRFELEAARERLLSLEAAASS